MRAFRASFFEEKQIRLEQPLAKRRLAKMRSSSMFGDKGHYKKACDRVREIKNAFRDGTVKGDEDLLKKEMDKLEKAIKLWEKLHGK